MKGSAKKFPKLILAGIACAILVLGAIEADAADLKAPFELENAKTLPKGVRNPRYKYLTMSVADKYNGLGVAEPLGRRLNKTLTFADLIESKDYEEDKAKIRAILSEQGMTESDSPGRTTGVVASVATVQVPVLAMGVTPRWTLAVAAPVMTIDIAATTGFVASAQGQQFIDAACAKDTYQCNTARADLNDAVNTKLRNKGYETIGARRFTAMGDAKLVSKYVLFQNEANSLSLKNEFTVPTGRKPDVNKAVDVPTGDGQYDVGLGLSYDRQLLPFLRANAFGNYIAQLPSRLERRLPVKNDDVISNDREMLKRDLGDVSSVGTSLTVESPFSVVSFGAGYSFQYINATSYSRGNYPEFRYRLLEAEMPYQALHSMTGVLGFSTVELFKRGMFKVPLQANVAYSKPVSGRNVTTNDVWAAELVMFF